MKWVWKSGKTTAESQEVIQITKIPNAFKDLGIGKTPGENKLLIYRNKDGIHDS